MVPQSVSANACETREFTGLHRDSLSDLRLHPGTHSGVKLELLLGIAKCGRPGRCLPGSGETARTGPAASAGRERRELAFNLRRVAIRALQIVVGILDATQ
jgi:hypothetical protein